MPHNTNRFIDGRGPWTLEAPELSPGETWYVDLRNMTYRGQNRYFSRFLPLDSGEVGNVDDTATVTVEFNGLYERTVYPNTTKAFSEAGFSKVAITNQSGSATIAAGDVRIEMEKTPYDDDEAARQSADRHPARKVVEGVTGVDPATLLGGK